MSNLTFNEYQQKTEETAIYQQSINTYVDSLGILSKEQADNLKQLLGFMYVVLGMVGEAGELANKVKKVIRDGNGQMTLSTMLDLAKENGDVTWYNARAYQHLGFTFGEGAQANLDKLFARKKANTLTGSGDNR